MVLADPGAQREGLRRRGVSARHARAIGHGIADGGRQGVQPGQRPIFVGRANAIARLSGDAWVSRVRSEEHTSELQYLMRNSYAVICLKKETDHCTTANDVHIL